MKILLVCAYDMSRPGGVQRHVTSLATALQANGHDVKIVAPGVEFLVGDATLKLDRKFRIRLAGTRFELSFIPRAQLKTISEELKRWRPDIVHYHAIWVPMMPWQILRILNAPAIATFHDTTAPGFTGGVMRGLFRILSSYLAKRLDGAIAVSKTPLEHLNIPNISIVPPAVDLTQFFSITQHESQPPLVLYWGRLEPRKGIPVLLEAIRKIAETPAGRTSMRFVIAGSGEGIEAIQKLQLELGGDILKLIHQPTDLELMQLLSMASLVVAPALYGESFGIVLIEAMASGLPVVAAANEGYRHVLTGKGAELLVPAGDGAALADKINLLLSDQTLRAELGAWAKNHAAQYDILMQLENIESTYRAAIEKFSRSKLDGR